MMADYGVVSKSEATARQVSRMSAQLRCALPGVIESFDPGTQTATVQPALNMKINLGDEVRQQPLPVVQNVPVVLPFAQGAGLLLTLPLAPGDECLLVFADRALDNFIQSGGVQCAGAGTEDGTMALRMHSLTDAICIPGLISNPQAVPSYSTEAIELRDRERVTYISLGPEGITMTDGVAVWKMSGGSVTLDAPAGITETSMGPVSTTCAGPLSLTSQTPMTLTSQAAISLTTPSTITMESANMTMGGKGGEVNEIEYTLRSRKGTFIDHQGVNLNTHVHSGVEPGGATTTTPVK